MKQKKIIFIHHIPFPYGPNFPKKGEDSFYYFGLGALMNDNIIKPMPFIFENWRMDPGIQAPLEKIVKGVKCRLFPAKKIKKIGAFSIKFFKELKKESHENEIIIHVTDTHSFALLIISFILRNVPVIATHLGGSHPYFKFKSQNKLYSYLKYLMERKLLKNVDVFFVSVLAEKEYFEKIVNKDKIEYYPVQGIENYFINEKPVNKVEARKKLGLPLEKKIILTLSRLDKTKGSDEILKVFKLLQKEYDVMWIAVGTSQRDEFYKQAEYAGVKLLPYVSRENGLKYYFYSADVYLYPMYKHKETHLFGGTGITTLEALASNLPYVGNGIEHLPDNAGNNAGIIPYNTEETYQGVKKVFNNPQNYGNTRAVVMKYYRWERIVYRYLSSYKKLFAKYYVSN